MKFQSNQKSLTLALLVLAGVLLLAPLNITHAQSSTFSVSPESESITMNTFSDLFSSNISLQRGDRSDLVQSLQQLLTDLNWYNSAVNGRFGPRTERAVKAFQINHDLAVDGVVGPATYAVLENYISGQVVARTSPFSAVIEPTFALATEICTPIELLPSCDYSSGSWSCDVYQDIGAHDYLTIPEAVYGMQLSNISSDGNTSIFAGKDLSVVIAGREISIVQLGDTVTSLILDEEFGAGTLIFEGNKIFYRIQNIDTDIWSGDQDILITGESLSVNSDDSLQLFFTENDAGKVIGTEYQFSGDCAGEVATVSNLASDESLSLGSCSYDIYNKIEECSGIGVEMVDQNSRRESALIKASGSLIQIEVDFDTDIQGWVLNVGNSDTNNGWGGDKDSADDAEFQIYNGSLLTFFRNEEGVFSAGLPAILSSQELDLDRLSEGSAEFTIVGNEVRYVFFDKNNQEIVSGAAVDDYLFDLEDAAVWVSVNQVVTKDKFGSGVKSLTVKSF